MAEKNAGSRRSKASSKSSRPKKRPKKNLKDFQSEDSNDSDDYIPISCLHITNYTESFHEADIDFEYDLSLSNRMTVKIIYTDSNMEERNRNISTKDKYNNPVRCFDIDGYDNVDACDLQSDTEDNDYNPLSLEFDHDDPFDTYVVNSDPLLHEGVTYRHYEESDEDLLYLKPGDFLPTYVSSSPLSDTDKRVRNRNHEKKHKKSSSYPNFDGNYYVAMKTHDEGDDLQYFTEDELTKLFLYGLKSKCLKGLLFDGCMLPLSFSIQSIPDNMNSRNIKVIWRYSGDIFRLNFRSGHWEVCDIKSVRRLCRSLRIVTGYHSPYQKWYAIRLLYTASMQNISIPRLSITLMKDGTIRLSGLTLPNFPWKADGEERDAHGDNIPITQPEADEYPEQREESDKDWWFLSGLTLPVLRTLKEMRISVEKYKTLTVEEVVQILDRFQDVVLLRFDDCKLPQSIPTKHLQSDTKARVSWFVDDDDMDGVCPIKSSFDLNLASGRWEGSGRREMSDYEYVTKISLCEWNWRHY